MSTLLKPLLGDQYPFRIEDGAIFYSMATHEVPLINNLNCKLSSILQDKNHLLNADALISYLKLHNLGSVVNRYLIRGNDVIEFGTQAGSDYIISVGGEVLGILNTNPNNTTIISSIQSALSTLTRYNQSISQVPEISDRTYKSMIDQDHISDYLSFDHMIEKSGIGYEFVYDLPLSYNPGPENNPTSQEMIYYDQQPLRYRYYKKTSIYQRSIKTGDIIEVVIGYRISDGANLPYSEHPIPLQKIMYGSNEIHYDGRYLLYGNTRAGSISATVVVGDVVKSSYEKDCYHIDLGQDLYMELSNDNLVVYSKSDRIQEYMVKSCKIIKPYDN